MQRKPCVTCGAVFQPKRTTAKYCSPRCRVREHRRPGLKLAPPPADRGTDVQDAVKLEIADLAGAASRPGLVAAAMSMAALLDDQAWTPQHPAAARSLDVLLSHLHDASKGSRTGKLAVMRGNRVQS